MYIALHASWLGRSTALEHPTRCAILALVLASESGCVYGTSKLKADGARSTFDGSMQSNIDLAENNSAALTDVPMAVDASGDDVSAFDVATEVDTDSMSDAGDVSDVPSDQDAGADADRVLGPVQAGRASWGDISGVVNCSYNLSPTDPMIASINETQYMGSMACGSCVQVTGPRATAVIRIVDQCQGCGAGNLVLNRGAFAQIALLSDGVVNVTWQQVPCDVNGPIEYFFKSDSSLSYLSLQIRNHRVPIRSLEVLQAERWVALKRENYNFFTSGYGSGPFSFRVTGIDDQVLVDTGIELSPGNTRKGAVQFW